MRLLLDTHVLLWYWEGNRALSRRARHVVEDGRNICFVSHVSAWETAVKASLGKLELIRPYHDLFPAMVRVNGWQILEPAFAHYQHLLNLPFHHRDPFDRLLVAQAMAEGLTLVTSDKCLTSYGVPTLW